MHAFKVLKKKGLWTSDLENYKKDTYGE